MGVGAAARPIAVHPRQGDSPPVRFVPEDEAPIDIEKLNRLDTDGDGVPDGFGDDCEPQPLRVDTATVLSVAPSPARVNQPLTLTIIVSNFTNETKDRSATAFKDSLPAPRRCASQHSQMQLHGIDCKCALIPLSASSGCRAGSSQKRRRRKARASAHEIGNRGHRRPSLGEKHVTESARTPLFAEGGPTWQWSSHHQCSSARSWHPLTSLLHRR